MLVTKDFHLWFLYQSAFWTDPVRRTTARRTMVRGELFMQIAGVEKAVGGLFAPYPTQPDAAFVRGWPCRKARGQGR